MRIFALSLTVLATLAACQSRDDTPDRPDSEAAAPVSPSAPAAPSPATPPAPEAPPPAASEPVRYFYFGNHVPRSVVTAIEGVDTASARLVGRTTPQDNYDYCIGYGSDPVAAAQRCAGEKVEQPEEVMTANCVARTVSDGREAVWVRDEPAADGKVLPVWRDRASGEIRDYSGAGGGLVLTAAFRILCPTASATITPRDY